ncbi:hypothetical protein EK21DRAFT_113318 [Setomelanomma holmii]|uniref:DUF7791 domain-containing protein n=1 Tax=Setomelanomma holmii TaxID=210430 RepID=A0A9P4H6K4_9PLEO|nr:hypothetical protein EK21DRAFT_113318 [Setomelanomma holmii]
MVQCYNQKDKPGVLPASLLRFAEWGESRVLAAGIEPSTSAENEKAEEEIAGRIRSRCAGMLELRPRQSISTNKPAAYVDYLHQSVTDFLNKRDIWHKITAHTAGTSFIANVAWLGALLMRLKRANVERWMPGNLLEMPDLIATAMSYALRAELSSNHASTALLDELDCTMLFRTSNGSKEDIIGLNFLAMSVLNGLLLYVQEKLIVHGKQMLTKTGKPLLGFARSPEMSECLLRHGAQPNETWGARGRSIWQDTLLQLRSTTSIRNAICLLPPLLQHGADPNAYIEEKAEDTGLLQQRSASRYLRSVVAESIGSVEYKVGLEDLIKHLHARGAQEEEWHMDEDGAWRKVYPTASESQPGADRYSGRWRTEAGEYFITTDVSHEP